MVMKHSGEFKFDQNIKVAINGMTFWIEDGRFWYSDRVNSCPDRLIAWKYPNERLEVIDAIIKAHAQKYPSVSITKMREAIPQTTIGRIMEGYELGLNFINDSIDDGMGVLFKVLESDTFSDGKQVSAGHFFNSKRASLRAVPIH